jgi:hypothetical protein
MFLPRLEALQHPLVVLFTSALPPARITHLPVLTPTNSVRQHFQPQNTLFSKELGGKFWNQHIPLHHGAVS